MKIFQICLKAFLLKEVRQEDSLRVITSFIDGVLIQDSKWKNIHNDNRYKGYCYNAFYPLERDGRYKKERVYQITIRSINQELIQYLAENLPKYENSYMKGLICNNTIIVQKLITTLYSITPVVVKGMRQNYWRDEMNFIEFGERLKINLIKKYRALLEEDLDENFELYTLLEITNRSPIAVPYKGIKLLADKIQMQVADNLTAQKLAFLSLGTGTGEMNSRGYGYMNAHFI